MKKSDSQEQEEVSRTICLRKDKDPRGHSKTRRRGCDLRQVVDLPVVALDPA
jgi:hypothetical protein